jgi:REP element-mobilizing transposase RayT
MRFDPEKHDRRGMRLKGYDYSQPGMYFVTICVHERQSKLGKITDSHILLSPYGEIAHDFWKTTSEHFPNAHIDEFIIMPNHIHAIVQIQDEDATLRDRTSRNAKPTLGQIIAYYKYGTTKQINALRDNAATKFWQGRFYDHIIRNHRELDAIRKYIQENVLKWELDRDNPKNL